MGQKLKLRDSEGNHIGMTQCLTLFSGEAIILEDLGDSHDGTNGCNQKGRIDDASEKQYNASFGSERLLGR